MNETEKRAITSNATPIEGKNFMGTKAIHLLGDISRDEEDLFYAYKETPDYWVGAWITGYGYFDVLFPKETSRELTPEEVTQYETQYIRLSNNPARRIKIHGYEPTDKS